jgi:hypothetical protein
LLADRGRTWRLSVVLILNGARWARRLSKGQADRKRLAEFGSGNER